MKPVFGWKTAKRAQSALPQLKASCLRQWDKTMYKLEARGVVGHATRSERSPKGVDFRASSTQQTNKIVVDIGMKQNSQIREPGHEWRNHGGSPSPVAASAQEIEVSLLTAVRTGPT